MADPVRDAVKLLAGISEKEKHDKAGLSASDQNIAVTLLKKRKWGPIEHAKALALCHRYRKQLSRFGFEWEQKK